MQSLIFIHCIIIWKWASYEKMIIFPHQPPSIVAFGCVYSSEKFGVSEPWHTSPCSRLSSIYYYIHVNVYTHMVQTKSEDWTGNILLAQGEGIFQLTWMKIHVKFRSFFVSSVFHTKQFSLLQCLYRWQITPWIILEYI